MTELLFENLKQKTYNFQKNLKDHIQGSPKKVNTFIPNEDIKNNFNYFNNDKINFVNSPYKDVQLIKKDEKQNATEFKSKNNQSSSKVDLNKYPNAENDDISKLNMDFSIKYKQSSHPSLFNQNFVSNNKVRYVRTELFPYKYYFMSIFLKNFRIKKKNCCFTYKFEKVQEYE